MKQKKELSRLTIEISKQLHTKLKVRCALANKSMRDLVNEIIKKDIAKFEGKMSLDQSRLVEQKETVLID